MFGQAASQRGGGAGGHWRRRRYFDAARSPWWRPRGVRLVHGEVKAASEAVRLARRANKFTAPRLFPSERRDVVCPDGCAARHGMCISAPVHAAGMTTHRTAGNMRAIGQPWPNLMESMEVAVQACIDPNRRRTKADAVNRHLRAGGATNYYLRRAALELSILREEHVGLAEVPRDGHWDVPSRQPRFAQRRRPTP